MIEDAILVDDTKPCPFCGETIKQVAIKCRYCGELIGDELCPGVFRQGKSVVIHTRSELPERCVKTNGPAERWLNKTFYWHPRWVYLLVLGGILPYAVAAVVTQKKARVRIPLSQQRMRRRLSHLLAAWAVALTGVGLFVFGLTKVNTRQPELVGWLVVSGIVTLLAGIIYGLIAANPLSPVKITDSHAWLKGAHPEYLAALPEWPGDL